jgi:hypothetical protein
MRSTAGVPTLRIRLAGERKESDETTPPRQRLTQKRHLPPECPSGSCWSIVDMRA